MVARERDAAMRISRLRLTIFPTLASGRGSGPELAQPFPAFRGTGFPIGVLRRGTPLLLPRMHADRRVDSVRHILLACERRTERLLQIITPSSRSTTILVALDLLPFL